MSEIFWHPVTAASRAPRFKTTWPRNDGLWGREWRHPSLPFDSLPYPTRAICRRVRTYVRTYARSVSHVTTKRKEVDHILWVWGSSHPRFARKGAPLKFCSDCNDCGRLFQILADALEKARSPSVFFDRREWSSNWILVLERRLYVEVFLMTTMLFR